MNKYLLARIKQDTPKMNPSLANGLATEYVPKAIDYIDRVWRDASKGFPPELRYVGCRVCTPLEEFYTDGVKSKKKYVELARSDIFLVRYDFTYNGVPLEPRYIYLPFANEAGSIRLGGSTYFISPILSDTVLSYEDSSIFVKLPRNKFAVRRKDVSILVDGKTTVFAATYASLYHFPANKKPIREVKAETTLFHYLLCRYGFYETFRRFTGATPIVMNSAPELDEYPASEWVHFKSSEFKPRGYPGKMEYLPTTLRVVVKRSECTDQVKSMIASLFYIADHFPDRIKAEYIDSIRLWRVLLGHLVFGSLPSEGKLHDDIGEHINSLEEYIDALAKERFKNAGFNIDSIFEFFAIAVRDYNKWQLKSAKVANDLYTKEISVLMDLLSPITFSIFTFHFKLKSALKKAVTERDIRDLFAKNIKPRSIFQLAKQMNGVSAMTYSGDNKCFKITNVVVPQKDTNGIKTKEAQRLDDPTKRLHISFAEVGSFINLSDSNITGENKLNLHVQLDANSKIVRNKELKPMLDKIQSMIKRN